MFGGGSSSEYEDIVSELSLAGMLLEQMLITAYTDKATDENLTSENWELILNLCDKVQDEGQSGYVVNPSICRIQSNGQISEPTTPLLRFSNVLRTGIPMSNYTHYLLPSHSAKTSASKFIASWHQEPSLKGSRSSSQTECVLPC